MAFETENIENLSIEDIETTLKRLQKKERLLKKILLEKLVKELDLTEDDLKDFKKAREEAWKEEKKKLGL
ncbi:MAG: hypothetical protein PWP15_1458 [Methanothermococcus sp.]|uniref:hypothetical protein n=1 Tax=Methanothermococcus TaxID=155862 RepID=UPI00036E36FD|nr:MULTISPECIES: hypothetical protein [Methanothermococcus]MDK2790949.1 hypothetical protein [Methanothermococcus sp.]MDK2978341.1 hypothetical protein [Bacteroidales bacterium]MDK2987925.1 hypothetical protein [Methanothermococcus sp.]